ncbi:hypothetical protein OIU76_002053 [Salix suchowensis]|nr:hypothetical protein OIU76_002053 [Salix suchowensis]
MAKQKAKKKPHTPSSHSPPQPPPNKKDVQPPLPVSLPPPLALDLHPTVKAISTKYGILGSVPVGPFGVGNSNFQHQHAPTFMAATVVPPEILSSDEESEVEESSSCDSNASSSNSSDLGLVDFPISSSPATNGASSPRAPVVGSGAVVAPSTPIGFLVTWLHLALWLLRMGEKEQVASATVLAEGAALSSQPSLADAVEIANKVDFASSSSDPMIAKVAAAVGEWEIVNKKKHNSRNVKQTANKGVGVGSVVPLDAGMVSRQKSDTITRIKVVFVDCSAQGVVHVVINSLVSQVSFHATFVYGLYTIVDRRDLWASLRKWCPSGPWLVLGDFYSILSQDDKLNGNAVSMYEIYDFYNCCHDLGLFDLNYSGCHFTWSNGHVWSKIDTVLVNPIWASHQQIARVHFGNQGAFSDHSFAMIWLDHKEKRRHSFKFFNIWTSHVDFLTTVSEN